MATLSPCKIMLMGLMLVSVSMPAMAKGNGHGHDHGHGHGHGHDDENTSYSVTTIESSDRVVIRDYLSDEYHRGCPPGLAKKHNGCLPPGQARKYEVGTVLPDYAVIRPVPQDVLVRLRPVPVGYRYVEVDQNVLLIGEASKKIIDAVTLLSAVQ